MKTMVEISNDIDSNLEKTATDEATSRAMKSANDEYYIDEMLDRQGLTSK